MANHVGPTWEWMAAGLTAIVITVGGWWGKVTQRRLSQHSDRLGKYNQRLAKMEQAVTNLEGWMSNISQKLDRLIERHLNEKGD